MEHLVVVGVPGKVAAIISAAIYDASHLDPAFGTPAGGKHQLFNIVSDWIVERFKAIPTQASQEQTEQLLDQVFGQSRPDHYRLLGM